MSRRLAAAVVLLGLASPAVALEAATCDPIARAFDQAAASMRTLADAAGRMGEDENIDALATEDPLRERFVELKRKRLAMLPELLAYVGELEATDAALKACAEGD
jgi:hypothetical protein